MFGLTLAENFYADFTIGFNFEVDDRFYSGTIHNGAEVIVVGSNGKYSLEASTYYGDSLQGANFMVIVY